MRPIQLLFARSSAAHLAATLWMALSSASCTSWHALGSPTPKSLDPRQQVQVWTHGSARVLHGVRLLGDSSLSGIPFQQRLECNSCRVELCWGDIDSLRTGNMENVGLVIVLVPVGIGAISALLMSGDPD